MIIAPTRSEIGITSPKTTVSVLPGPDGIRSLKAGLNRLSPECVSYFDQ